ncbi:MAG TPA: permease [Pelagibacterium sp.]|uniref:permease n=1 Tax=Pelagibacterium sp. TaxID=1967288 RepID=UPI002C1D3A13|nr:permease [Pelagibacterium sp.]HWJ87950.1 permease [Pelagibacterium sp.]
MSSPTPKRSPFVDGGFLFLSAIALGAGVLAVVIRGPSAIGEAVGIVFSDALFILPLIAMGVVVGSLFTLLVPREAVSRYLGQQAGIKGILIASFVGTVMPAGPFAAFPIVLALGRSGAAIGALVAFLTAWAAVGLHRLFVWELPFMGGEFAALRFITSLPVPVIAGLLADRLSNGFAVFRIDWENAQ